MTAAAPKTMTTYKHADGELVDGEYGWVADLDGYEADALVPVDWVRETWQLVSTETVTTFPPLYDCGLTDCDEDAKSWQQVDGAWSARCGEHGG